MRLSFNQVTRATPIRVSVSVRTNRILATEFALGASFAVGVRVRAAKLRIGEVSNVVRRPLLVTPYPPTIVNPGVTILGPNISRIERTLYLPLKYGEVFVIGVHLYVDGKSMQIYGGGDDEEDRLVYVMGKKTASIGGSSNVYKHLHTLENDDLSITTSISAIELPLVGFAGKRDAIVSAIEKGWDAMMPQTNSMLISQYMLWGEKDVEEYHMLSRAMGGIVAVDAPGIGSIDLFGSPSGEVYDVVERIRVSRGAAAIVQDIAEQANRLRYLAAAYRIYFGRRI